MANHPIVHLEIPAVNPAAASFSSGQICENQAKEKIGMQDVKLYADLLVAMMKRAGK